MISFGNAYLWRSQCYFDDYICRCFTFHTGGDSNEGRHIFNIFLETEQFLKRIPVGCNTSQNSFKVDFSYHHSQFSEKVVTIFIIIALTVANNVEVETETCNSGIGSQKLH